MPFKILSALGVSLLAFASVGCNTVDRHEVDALKAYNAQLEREATDLRKCKYAYETMKDQLAISETESKLLEDLRVALLEALKGTKIETGDVQYDPTTGKWTLASDLLFDSGSFKLVPKGEEVLKKFAETHRTKGVFLRIVGHTDRDPIKKPGTLQSLHFDDNMELGALRACAVFMALSKHGVAKSRMLTQSCGNNNPVAPNDNSSEHKKKNRRVEIYVLADGAVPQRR